jgi:hypothetical protein
MKKSSDFDHEKINLVEKNVGTPAILGRTLWISLKILVRLNKNKIPFNFNKIIVMSSSKTFYFSLWNLRPPENLKIRKASRSTEP